MSSLQLDRRFGSGWISGVLGVFCSSVGILTVLCFLFPHYLTLPETHKIYTSSALYIDWIRLALQVMLLAGFALGVLSVTLRQHKKLGFLAIVLALIATVLGGANAQRLSSEGSGIMLGLDWFLLNLLFTGLIFIPLERLFGRTKQAILRQEWREDLLYFLLSSLLVQGLSYLSLSPAMAILHHTQWGALRGWVAGLPFIVQFVAIMFLTDLVQYWVHRLFHKVGFLWKFHAVHHSAPAMDWLAGSRMHFAEIVFLRAFTIIPMMILGFAQPAMYAYIGFVYLFATFVHAKIRFNYYPLRYVVVTPLFHHWHHGIEKEAIDVNFAVHFPWLDKLFGTFYLPKDGRWPSGYGIKAPMPHGFIKQFLYPFSKKKS